MNWDLFPLSLFDFYDNEHRPVFPLLVYLADIKVFGAVGTLSWLIMMACNTLIALLPALVSGKDTPPPTRFLIAGAGLFIMFWAGHFENFQWPKQVHMYMSVAAGLVGSWMLLSRDGSGPGVIVVSATLLFISAFSFAFGFMVVAALPPVALLRRDRTAAAVATGVLAVCAAIYLYIFVGSYQFHVTSRNAANIESVVMFSLRMLGAPPAAALDAAIRSLGTAPPPWWLERGNTSVAFGILGAAGYGLLACGLRTASAPAGLIAVIGASVMAVALPTAAARIDYGQMAAVDTSRYYVLSGVFWLGLCAWAMIAPSGRRPAVTAARWAAVVSVALLVVISTPHFTMEMLQQWARARLSGAAGASGLAAVYPYHFWYPELLPSLHAEYAADRATIYSHPWARALGRPVAELGGSGICPGQAPRVARIADTDGGYLLEGRLPPGTGTDAWLVVTDAAGLVAGYGVAGATPSSGHAPEAWTALAVSVPAAVHLVRPDGGLCRLGEAPPPGAEVHPYAKPPFVATFEAARDAPAPDGLSCPDGRILARWLTGRLVCLPSRLR